MNGIHIDTERKFTLEMDDAFDPNGNQVYRVTNASYEDMRDCFKIGERIYSENTGKVYEVTYTIWGNRQVAFDPID
jgi:hypothetical protein